MKGDGMRKGANFVEFALENLMNLFSRIDSDQKLEEYSVFTAYIDNYNSFAVAEDLGFYKGYVDDFKKEDILKRISPIRLRFKYSLFLEENLLLSSIHKTMVTAMSKILSSRNGDEPLIETSGFTPETYETLFDMSVLMMQIIVATVEGGNSLQVDSFEPAKHKKMKTKGGKENPKPSIPPYTIKSLSSLQHYQAERSRALIELLKE